MISDYYSMTFTLYDNTRTKTSGVVKDNKVMIKTFNGIIDPQPSEKSFVELRKQYNFTHVLYCGMEDIVVDQIINDGTDDFEVVSVINPLNRNNHLEILLNRKS